MPRAKHRVAVLVELPSTFGLGLEQDGLRHPLELTRTPAVRFRPVVARTADRQQQAI